MQTCGETEAKFYATLIFDSRFGLLTLEKLTLVSTGGYVGPKGSYPRISTPNPFL
jgi:hypothetical protein